MGLIPRWNKLPPPAPQSRKSICPAPEPVALKMSRPDSMDRDYLLLYKRKFNYTCVDVCTEQKLAADDDDDGEGSDL